VPLALRVRWLVAQKHRLRRETKRDRQVWARRGSTEELFLARVELVRRKSGLLAEEFGARRKDYRALGRPQVVGDGAARSPIFPH
jgi:hypothetical protein